MKRLFVPLLIVIFMVLTGCAVPSGGVDSDISKQSNYSDTPSLLPVYLIKARDGTVLQYIYEFDNQLHQHCTLAVDALFYGSSRETNAASALVCK